MPVQTSVELPLTHQSNNEEPSEPVSEESVPLDGRDEVGEAMMKNLPSLMTKDKPFLDK